MSDPQHAWTFRRATFDIVALANIAVFAAAEAVTFHGGLAFRLFGAGMVGLFLVGWWVLRRHEYPVWAVVMLQLTVLGHLAGRLIYIGDENLYVVVLAGIPMDKVIHAFNTAAGTVFLTVLFRKALPPLRGWEPFVVVMVAAGLGSIVEIVEYLGTLVLPSTSVGDYANNAQDLIANLGGAVVAYGLVRLFLGRTGQAGDTSAPAAVHRPTSTRRAGSQAR